MSDDVYECFKSIMEDTADEMKWVEDLSKARSEMDRMKGKKPASQVMFKVI